MIFHRAWSYALYRTYRTMILAFALSGFDKDRSNNGTINESKSLQLAVWFSNSLYFAQRTKGRPIIEAHAYATCFSAQYETCRLNIQGDNWVKLAKRWIKADIIAARQANKYCRGGTRKGKSRSGEVLTAISAFNAGIVHTASPCICSRYTGPTSSSRSREMGVGGATRI